MSSFTPFVTITFLTPKSFQRLAAIFKSSVDSIFKFKYVSVSSLFVIIQSIACNESGIFFIFGEETVVITNLI